jgi:hypothetical protein
MKYVLLFCGTDQDAAAFNALSPDELRQRYTEVGKWFQEHQSSHRRQRAAAAVDHGDDRAPRMAGR